MGMIRVFLFFACMFAGTWKATQVLAEKLHYDPLLGQPLGMSNGVPYYGPWKFPIWWAEFYDIVPKAFQDSVTWILAGVFFFMVFLILSFQGKTSTNYGSARWAQYKDLMKMDVLSAHGVVIGLYDGAFARGFTTFYRWLETKQNTKVKFAELAFENRTANQRDRLVDRLSEIEMRLDTAKGTERKHLMEERDKLNQTLDKTEKYKPIMNPFTVFPWVWVFKRMGWFYNRLSHFYLRDNSNKHMAVIAPTRSGKGVGLIIPTLLGSWNSSCIVNDIKRENWEVTAGYRKRMGQVCIKFEPTKADGTTARWNPLDEIPIGTPKELMMAQNIAHTLADYEGKGKLDHWGSNAEVVILTVMLHLSYAYYSDRKNYPMKPNLSTIANFLKANMVEQIVDAPDVPGGKKKVVQPKGFVDSLQAMMQFKHVPDAGIMIEEWSSKESKMVKRKFLPKELHDMYYMYTDIIRLMPNTHPLIYKNFMEIVAKPENECGSIVSTANTALKEYLDPVLAANTAVSDFCIDDIMNYKKPVSLYLVTPPSDLLRLSPIFRLFFETMIKHHAADMGFKNARPVDLYKHKCLLLMDEFSSLGNLQTFASTMSYIAGYGMKVFLIIQGKPQMDKIYGKDNDIFLNCHMQIFYGPNETETAKYAADQLGDQTIIAEDPSQGLFNFKQQRSKKEMARKLMTMDELKQLGDREIILASGFPPLLTWKVKYYEDKYFTSKLVPAPVVSDLIRMNGEKPLFEYSAWESAKKKGMKGSEKSEDSGEHFDFEPNWDQAVEKADEQFSWVADLEKELDLIKQEKEKEGGN